MYLSTNLKELLHCKNIQKIWMQLIPVRHSVLQENKLSTVNPLIPAGLYQNYFHMHLKKKSKITALSSFPSEKCIFNCRFTVCFSVHALWFFFSAKEQLTDLNVYDPSFPHNPTHSEQWALPVGWSFLG